MVYEIIREPCRCSGRRRLTCRHAHGVCSACIRQYGRTWDRDCEHIRAALPRMPLRLHRPITVARNVIFGATDGVSRRGEAR